MSEHSEKYGMLPCPFCGSDDLRITNLMSSVKCGGCGTMVTMSGAQICAAGYGKENRAERLVLCWNKRI